MRKTAIVACLALMLAACGGGSAQLASNGGTGSGSSSSSSGGTSSSSGSSVTAATLNIQASTLNIPDDGSASVTITAIADTSTNVALAGVNVSFTATAGGNLAIVNNVTNSSGAAVATVTAVGSPAPGSTITVTASAPGIKTPKTITLNVVSNTTVQTTVSMGSGAGSGFTSGTIYISSPSISAGGSTTLQVNLVDQNGNAYTQSTAVTFSSPCQGNSVSTITGQGGATGYPTTTTASGTATATYVAAGCSGPDKITAMATANGQNLSATGTVTVAAATLGSIQFISSTPKNITLKGLGSEGGSSTSTVVFQVLDSVGGPLQGATVNFALSTTVGGVSLTPTSGTTDAEGKVQTVISSGTVAEPVTVKASTVNTTTGATIYTESNALTISTGIPTSAGISASVSCWNVEAWEQDGTTVPVTVRMRDRFSNPVPDGTTVNFHTLLGHIDSSCQTGPPNSASGSGTCTVNWVSQAPYSVSGNPQSTFDLAYNLKLGNVASGTTVPPGTTPTSPPDFYPNYAAYCGSVVDDANKVYGTPTGLPLCNATTNGRSPILAYTVGEESFVDAVNTGVFNSTLDTVPFNADNPWNNFGTYTGPWGEDAPYATAPTGGHKSWQDLGDPFLNQWELYTCYASDTVCDPIFVLGEFFYDFFNTGTWATPDGLIESALCDKDTTPTPAVSYCNPQSSTVGIGASNIIILSGLNPNFTWIDANSGALLAPPYSALTLPGAIDLQVSDQRYQQMPNGTTVTFAISPSTAGTISSPTGTFIWPCSTAVGGQAFQIIMAPPTSGATSGSLIVTVTTPPPNQVITSTAYPLAN